MMYIYTIKVKNGIVTIISEYNYIKTLNLFKDFFDNQKEIILLNSELITEIIYKKEIEILRKNSKYSIGTFNFLIFNIEKNNEN